MSFLLLSILAPGSWPLDQFDRMQGGDQSQAACLVLFAFKLTLPHCDDQNITFENNCLTKHVPCFVLHIY